MFEICYLASLLQCYDVLLALLHVLLSLSELVLVSSNLILYVGRVTCQAKFLCNYYCYLITI